MSILGSVLFVVSFFLGILVALFFPLDAGGEFTTYNGKMHTILIVTSGSLTIAGIIVLWFSLETIEG